MNDYLFGQGEFSAHDADTIVAQRLIQLLDDGQGPTDLDTDLIWMSDVLLQLKRTRDDVLLVQSIV